jgi:hypothetical protein
VGRVLRARRPAAQKNAKPVSVVEEPSYAERPCYPELVVIAIVGLVHVVLEIELSEPASQFFNATASVGFLIYLIWRGRRSAGALRAWGIRLDNFGRALRAQLGFGVVAAVGLLGFGAVTGWVRLPWTFWLTVALYPLWGVAQQFALQNLIARNLTGLLSNRYAVAGVSATLFGAAHYPRLELVVLTLVSGFFFTAVYRRVPNLWAVGIVHGILGSLAVYIVLHEDPGAAIAGFLFRF